MGVMLPEHAPLRRPELRVSRVGAPSTLRGVDEQGEPKRPDLIGQVMQGEITHAEVKPLDLSGIGAVITGEIAWAVAFVVLLVFFRDDLERSGNQWWLWVPVAGFGLGLLGLYYCKRRWDAIKRDQQTGTAAAQASDDSSSS
jgi:Protein of unknown function (DUF2530)